MSETFVDLTYRGLALGRRIKLTRVRATSGFLEHPTPMPVGTAVAMATDDGLVFDTVVEAIHEQVGGSEQAPGMHVRPVFATEQLSAWWSKHVEAEAPGAPERARPITVRPRTQAAPEPAPAVVFPIHTIPNTLQLPQPAGAQATVFDLVEPPAKAKAVGTSTIVMNAIDLDLLTELSKDESVENLTRRIGEHDVIDDGMRTSVMDVVDPSALGLDVSTLSNDSDPSAAGDDDDDDRSAAETGPIDDAQGNDKKPKTGGTKKRKKRR